ncbi:uncharacterized protein (DUF58 family) [Catalinimonas alkaloidigena]|uniref:DUF58 domain-containing protein n=1 Tax=Catalinimonas alkaloidigena TaxID=1075417 RepID=UPI0024066A4F|nr:DUF58 domain-containing protein [Catalinimonas alkaloidigena]MDF9795178.1 uncharacterized protein (DUF58 family) [Catalinimonas alkaloidigena]
MLQLREIREFGNIEMLAKQMVEGFITGLHKSPYHGFSVEFAEHRLYNSGESTRHIDWKVYAKTDRLYTKRYEEETNLRCQLVIDNSSSMYYPQENMGKITFSIMTAAALAYLLQKQRDAFGLCIFSDDIEQQTQVKSTSSHLHKLFIILEAMLKSQPKMQQTSVASVLHQVAEKINKRSLVIIFSDMFENFHDKEKIFGALQHLKHNKHEVLLFHVTDHKTELDFDFDERPYEFIDVEKGDRLKLQPSQIKEAYRKQMEEYYHELKIKCGQAKIDFIEADINEGFDHILRSYLIKRASMK